MSHWKDRNQPVNNDVTLLGLARVWLMNWFWMKSTGRFTFRLHQVSKQLPCIFSFRFQNAIMSPRGITSQKQHNFPSIEFWWSLRCEDKRDSAVCFNGRKMLDLFFFSRRMFGIRYYLNLVLHTAAKQRRWSSRAHNGTGLSAVSLRLLGEGAPAPKRCFAARNCSSAGALTSAEDVEVTLSVWNDVSISIFFFSTQRHHLAKPCSAFSWRLEPSDQP